MSKAAIQTTISPYTQQPILTRPLLSEIELDSTIAEAVKAQKSWRKVSLDDRIAIAQNWLVGHPPSPCLYSGFFVLLIPMICSGRV